MKVKKTKFIDILKIRTENAKSTTNINDRNDINVDKRESITSTNASEIEYME